MSKQKLADKAGVSLNTLNKWLSPLLPQLEAMGMPPSARILPPNIVQFIAERFCIDVGP